ncbi:iron-containing alcohol dehydrogenase family protein [Leptolyngbya sp. PCC 6406]|uniref:iron-containing alcohol dehydrogenase family protein n=1 Tax=Leptolyngbya sp. PCC 6406 TaxID=1173264 RepID=UPI0002AB9A1E|nr:iron-containing alcohol dehydrogenase family protein [Leptolyngbya sp. PCC 6406]
MLSTVSTLLTIAPAQVVRGAGILADQGSAIARLGQRPLVTGGDRAIAIAAPALDAALGKLTPAQIPFGGECSEATLTRLRQAAEQHQADVIVGVGGGKALDAAKLLAHQLHLPVVTVPTTAATCAAWTALSNIYSDTGAFLYDVPLDHCPDRLVLDYDLIVTAPQRTLIAGIGDALAKWYEASVSSGTSDQTLIIAAVQQARVLRDILFQKTAAALAAPGSEVWREVVDAAVLMAGVIGGLGGAQCRTVAAHAIHNGLTHLPASHGTLHGEKVAYGILVQLRLEEMAPGTSLAATARQQLRQFYDETGLPQTLRDLNMGDISLADLTHAATVACREGSDIHHLPFSVTPEAVAGAMVSTTAALMVSRTS